MFYQRQAAIPAQKLGIMCNLCETYVPGREVMGTGPTGSIG